MIDRLNILAQSSDFYCPFCGVMLESLFYNNIDIEKIKVYLISDNIGNDNLSKIKELSLKYNCEIEIIDGTLIKEKLKKHNVSIYHGSYTLYFKLFAIDYIKDDIDQLLYLDSDMIVNGSLRELLNIDLHNCIVGMTEKYIDEKHFKRIKGNNKYSYGSGLVLFDVKRWKYENYSQKIIDHFYNCGSLYLHYDEDIFYLVVKEIYPLDLKYNTLLTYFDITQRGGLDLVNKTFFYKFVYTDEEWKDAYANPLIIHYSTWFTSPPWVKNSKSPFLDIWDKYLIASPWYDFKKIDASIPLVHKIQYFLYKTLPIRLFSFLNRNILKIHVYFKEKRFSRINTQNRKKG